MVLMKKTALLICQRRGVRLFFVNNPRVITPTAISGLFKWKHLKTVRFKSTYSRNTKMSLKVGLTTKLVRFNQKKVNVHTKTFKVKKSRLTAVNLWVLSTTLSHWIPKMAGVIAVLKLKRINPTRSKSLGRLINNSLHMKISRSFMIHTKLQKTLKCTNITRLTTS